jgi:uncharacterized protein YndB with AHSA1/START domain
LQNVFQQPTMVGTPSRAEGLVFSTEGQVIKKSIRTNAYPEQVWEAWTDGDRLAQWLADKATGWPAVGSSLSLTWERFGFTVQYQIAEAKTCQRLVWKSRMGTGFQTLTVEMRREGPQTIVDLQEAAPAYGQQSDDSSSDSAWQMNMAIFKLYVERYFGQARNSFFSLVKSNFTIPALLGAYATAKGLEEWLAEAVEVWPDAHKGSESKFSAEQFSEALTDKPYRLRLPGGMTMSGHIMTVTSQEVALSWDEINGFLELKCFSMGPGNQAVCFRGSGYGITAENASQLEELLKPRLVLLAESLAGSE